MGSVNVITGPAVAISDNVLLIDEISVASWKDDVSPSCTVELTLIPTAGEEKTINSGDQLSKEGKFQIKATDESGNSSTADITLTREDGQAPTIEVKIVEKNVIAGVKVTIEGNQLFFDESIAATWTDDYTEICAVELSFSGGAEINSGDTLSEEGTLIITVADEFQNKTTAEIVLSAVAIYGLENLENLSMQVDEAINLLQGITIAEGLTLHGVEYEKDDEIALVSDPESFVLEYPCTICIILTVAKPDGTQIEIRVDGISVNPLEFNVPALETADVINENYPWFNKLTQWYLELGYDPSVLYNKQIFVYPHVLVSYITGERYRWDNLEYIIVGEIPGSYECEDV